MRTFAARTLLALGAAALLAAAPIAGADPAVRAGQTATASAFTLLLTGGNGPNDITVSYESEEYVIRANGPVAPPDPAEVPNSCYNPPGETTELHCPKSDIVGLLVRGRGGNDSIIVSDTVNISVIISGGPGLDDIAGGSNTDKLIGGDRGDRLVGRGGADFLYGNRGRDLLRGGRGKDVLRGGPGIDVLRGGPGRDDELQ